ncbi:Proliferating cell nuclear antigen like [Actinidia chinensis var. chinensis]|uniref:Proliferating cell nuclear antigen like n=1 Tax=Actinidia chinensis var. chinensis TaxID=1590841 RepID=A0A2R6Q8V8_ACTCC|nr:Proliferating cell nuclear antigen like [Actinidia chinensis var. chinensis]
MIGLKKIQGNQLRGLLSPLMRIGNHGAAIWVHDSFTVSTESITVQLRLEYPCFDHYVCSEPTRTWLNLHHLDHIFSSTAGDESLIMSALTSANHRATNMYFVYEHHGTDTFRSETNLRGCAIPHHHRTVNKSELSYQAAIGIPLQEFRCIIWHFAEHRTQFVEAHVMDGQVRFRSGFFEDIVLTTEGGGCTIANRPENGEGWSMYIRTLVPRSTAPAWCGCFIPELIRLT